MRHRIIRLFFLTLAALAGQAHANPLQFGWTVPPMWSGTDWNLQLSLANSSGANVAGPFVVRVYLPGHVEFRGNNAGQWTCSAQPGNAQQVNCSWPGTLTPANWSAPHLGVYARTSPAIPPTTHTLRATVETPTVPAPDPALCTGTPSSSGCLVAQIQAQASRLDLTDWGYTSDMVTAPGPVAEVLQPFEAGVERRVLVGFQPSGYGVGNIPMTARFHLPAGLTFQGLSNGIPTFTCSSQPDGGGQLVTCSTPYVVQPGFVNIRVLAAANIDIPGPLYLHARLESDSQQVSLAECIADPVGMGCGRLAVHTRLPRAPRLELGTPGVLPAEFRRGQQGHLDLPYRNAGDGMASASRLVRQLPPGVSWNRTTAVSMTCMASGDPAIVGQVVGCAGPAVPENLQLAPHFVLDVLYNAADTLPVLIGVDMGEGSDQSLLDDCAADPLQAHCALLEVPVAWRCADPFGADGIHCDRFELPPTL